MTAILWVLFFLAACGLFCFQRASLLVSTIGIGLYFLLLSYFSNCPHFLLAIYWVLYAGIFVVLNVRALRTLLITQSVFRFYQGVMPHLSQTEQEALTAGSVAWEGELFGGMPNWDTLQQLPLSSLSTEERAFMDGPVETFCTMVKAWDMHHSMNIPTEILDFLRKRGFLGMIIPKKYGGLEFSHFAHSQVITKMASASCAAAILTSVPNSLGPAELLLRYGTEVQRDYYLPRLACGDEVPCFALTSPMAGSDAGALEDYGIVCEEVFEGKKQLCLRLTWNKRYITLAPVATLLGLAFKLYDPEHLLGQKTYLGITCALIATNLPGVEVGRRHAPLHSPFPNGPTRGKDVLVPIDAIIGGAEMAGQGWRMLMECLAAGRGISLPSMVTGGSRLAALATGAYACTRRQFHLPIAKLGGVEEVLARIAANVYAAEAVRTITVSILDQGARPAVASAIAKYNTTELARRILIDAMDIHGGKGICMGPNNYLAQGYIELPVGITVEGANILTRSMIIFGQGAVRCHPYVLAEMTAAQEKNVQAFDKAVFAHLGFMLSNKVRAFVLGLTNGCGARAPSGPLKRYYQQFSRFSAALAYLADVAMMTMGGALKRAEKLSGRFSDVFSCLYVGSCVLRFYEAGQSPQEELPVLQWVCEDLLFKIQTQIDALLANFPNRLLSKAFRMMVFPRGKYLQAPSDHLGASVANLLITPSAFRDRIAEDLYTAPNENNPGGRAISILEKMLAAEPLEKKLDTLQRDCDPLASKTHEALIDLAEKNHAVTAEEAKQLREAFAARMSIVNVDDFPAETF